MGGRGDWRDWVSSLQRYLSVAESYSIFLDRRRKLEMVSARSHSTSELSAVEVDWVLLQFPQQLFGNRFNNNIGVLIILVGVYID